MKKIAASLVFCVAVMVAFAVTAAASRGALPVGLRDLYGDTSGIHRLTIEGEVLGWNGRYGYSFSISPDESAARMHIFRNERAFSDFANRRWLMQFSWQFHWHSSFFNTAYVPLEENPEIIVSESERSFTVNMRGERIPSSEHRIFGSLFEVVPMFHGFRLYVPGQEGAHRLYVDAGTDGYIYLIATQDNLEIDFSDRPNWHFMPSFANPSLSSLWLPSQLVIGETHVFVSAGAGMFGSTAVYAVRVENGVLPTSQDILGEWPVFMIAEELHHIQLERGEDEVLGLLDLENGDFLLIIRRAAGYEVTRINPTTGEAQTVLVERDVTFNLFFLQDDSFVLRGHGAGGFGGLLHVEIAAFDLSHGGLALVGAFDAHLGGGTTDVVQIIMDTTSVVQRDGVVYIAYTISFNPWERFATNNETFISAFDCQGRLVGRSKVLNGVEDDFTFAGNWGWNVPNPLSRYHRRIQFISIR